MLFWKWWIALLSSCVRWFDRWAHDIAWIFAFKKWDRAALVKLLFLINLFYFRKMRQSALLTDMEGLIEKFAHHLQLLLAVLNNVAFVVQLVIDLIERVTVVAVVPIRRRLDWIHQLQRFDLVRDKFYLLLRLLKLLLKLSSLRIDAKHTLAAFLHQELLLLRLYDWNLMDHAVDQMLHKIRIYLNWIKQLVLSDIFGHRLHKTAQVLEVSSRRIKFFLTFIVLVAVPRLCGRSFLRLLLFWVFAFRWLLLLLLALEPIRKLFKDYIPEVGARPQSRVATDNV